MFADELREGLKHYQNRIPKEVRTKGNFFQVAIDEFIDRIVTGQTRLAPGQVDSPEWPVVS